MTNSARARKESAGRPRDESMTPHILAAVLAIVADTGYQMLRIEDVAARAGVSLGSVYRRWPTKEELVVAALDSSPPPFTVVGTGDAAVDFVAVLTDLATALSEPDHLRLALLAADPGEPVVSAAARRQIPSVRRHVRSLVADRVGPGHPALELFADAGPALVWYRALVAGGQVDAPGLVRELTAVVLDRAGYVPARSSGADVVAGTPGPDGPRSRRQDRIRNRRKIIAAAAGLLRERPFAEVHLEDVALRAGVSPATVARHTGTKRQLVAAVRKERMRDVIRLAERCGAEADPWWGVQMVLRSVAGWAAEDRDLRDVVDGAGLGDDGEWRSLRRELFTCLDAVLDRARDAGLLRPEVSATDAVRLVVAASTAAGVKPADSYRYADILLGLRRSEVCGLRWEHIDFAAGTLRVAQSVQRVEGQLKVMPTKSKRSNRTVPLPSRCRYALAEHHARLQRRDGGKGTPGRPSGYVFGTTTGTPLEPRNLTRMFRALCEANGIRVVRLHDLRHTCVSLLLAQGVHPRVVMEIVGHSAIEMTMNVYGHVNLDTQRQALDDLDSGLSDDADS